VYSPGDGLLLPRARCADMRIRDASEVDQLASALPDRYGSLATVAAYTGLRWGELTSLQTHSIDRPRERLNVRTSSSKPPDNHPSSDHQRPTLLSARSRSPRSSSMSSIVTSTPIPHPTPRSGPPSQAGSYDAEPSGEPGDGSRRVSRDTVPNTRSASPTPHGSSQKANTPRLSRPDSATPRSRSRWTPTATSWSASTNKPPSGSTP
jgi:integrase